MVNVASLGQGRGSCQWPLLAGPAHECELPLRQGSLLLSVSLRFSSLEVEPWSYGSGKTTGKGHRVFAQLPFSCCCPGERLLLSPGLGQGELWALLDSAP